MWTATDTVDAMKGKSYELRELFANTANQAIQKGRTKDEAVHAGIAAVSAKERYLQKSAAKDRPKIVQEKPAHILAIEKAAEIKKKQAQEAIDKAKVEEQQKTIKSVDVDTDGKIVVTFENGKKVKSKNSIQENVTKNVTVVAGGSGGGASSASDAWETVVITEDIILDTTNPLFDLFSIDLLGDSVYNLHSNIMLEVTDPSVLPNMRISSPGVSVSSSRLSIPENNSERVKIVSKIGEVNSLGGLLVDQTYLATTNTTLSTSTPSNITLRLYV